MFLYFNDYQSHDCNDVISKEEYDHLTKMLNYKPTEGELREHKKYSEEADRMYQEYMKENELTELYAGLEGDIDENELNLPEDPSDGKGYFIEKGAVLELYYIAPLKKYEKCNKPWYWRYLNPTLFALIIYFASLVALWLTYSIVNWVIKGFKEGK